MRPRWKALYVVARKHGLTPAAAEDAVQGFLARLLEGDVLERLDPGKGRLRSYLRTAFRHYVALSHRRRALAFLFAPECKDGTCSIAR